MTQEPEESPKRRSGPLPDPQECRQSDQGKRACQSKEIKKEDWITKKMSNKAAKERNLDISIKMGVGCDT